MTYNRFEYLVAVGVHERTGWPLDQAELFTGDVADLHAAKYTISEVVDELLAAIAE